MTARPRANGVEVRRALVAWIRAGNSPDAAGVVLEELDVGNGAARADVAVADIDAVTAIEIKGDGDDLSRFPRQARAFSEVGNFCVLVARASMLATARTLHQFGKPVLPDHWGLLAFDVGDSGIVFDWARKPIAQAAGVAASLRFLWRPERLALLCRHGHARGVSGRSCWGLADRIIEVVDADVARAFVRERLATRSHLFPENREPGRRVVRYEWRQCRACGYRVKPEAQPCAACGLE